MKGLYPKGDSCPFPHLDEESVARIRATEKRPKDLQKEPDKGTERGRSPSPTGGKALQVLNEDFLWCVGVVEID